MAKVPNVLGNFMSPKFLGHIEIAGPNGGTRKSPVYNFPRKEAIRMAMSYSYKLQEMVLDAWDAAEEKDGVQTMSSLAMVEYINSTREPGEAILRHDHFLAKVPQVLQDAPKFRAMSEDTYGRPQPCYNFPKREAMLMAMSYSHKLQAKVYDAWQEAEAKLAPVATLGAPTSYLDALKQLVANVGVTERQQLQLAQQAVQIEAAKPLNEIFR